MRSKKYNYKIRGETKFSLMSFLLIACALFGSNNKLNAQTLVNDNAIIKIGSGAYLTVKGNIVLENTAGINNSGNIMITKNWTNNANGLISNGLGTVLFNGSSPQIIQGIAPTVFHNLAINNASGVAQGISTFVDGTLALTLGNYTLASSSLTLGNSAVAGSPFSNSNMIVADGTGQLRRPFTSNESYLFPIGDNTGLAEYSPVNFTLSSGNLGSNPYVAVNLVNTKHPNNGNTNNYLNRYWNVSTNDITSPVYTVDANYLAADIQGSDANISMGQYTGALPWIKYAPANTLTKQLTASNVTTAGASAFSGISTANPTASIDGGNVTVCSGSTVTLNAMTTGDPIASYYWLPGGQTTSSITVSPTANTTYTLTVTDVNGFTATANSTVSVSNPALVSVSTSSTEVCTAMPTIYLGYGSQSQTLTASTVGGTAPFTYNWSNGATTQTTTVSPVITTTYTVMVTDASGCTSSAQQTVLVQDVRDPKDCGKNNNCKVFICHNGHTISVSTNAVSAHLAHGDCLGQCPDDNNKNASNSNEEVAEHNHTSLMIYPNPNNGEFNFQIEAENPSEGIEVMITDFSGKILFTKNYSNVNVISETINLNILNGGLASGMYFIKATNGEHIFTEKISIQNK